MKKQLQFIYPAGDCLHPVTGGQVWDNRLLTFLQQCDNLEVTYDGADHYPAGKLGRIKALFARRRQLAQRDAIVYNAALFPYFLPLLAYLRLTRAKTRIYGIHHHFRYEEKSGASRILFREMERMSLRLHHSTITPNAYTRDVADRLHPGADITFLEMAFHHEGASQAATPLPGRFLFVGSIYERKGLHYLVEAARLLPQDLSGKITFDIAGNVASQAYYDSLKQKIAEYGLEKNFRFHGRVEQEELEKLYASCTGLVLPSLLEGYGMVIMEAMKHGVPVIAFDNSAIPYVVRHEENGLLVKDRDAEAFADAVKRLHEDTALRARLAQGAAQSFAATPSMDDFKRNVQDFAAKL